MATIFSSDEVHPRDRFGFWHEVACQTIVKHHSVPEVAANFHARLSAQELDDIALMLVESAPMTVSRDRQLIAKADHDDYLLCLQREGLVQFQGDNDIGLAKGMATLLDPSHGYSGRFVGECKMLVTRLPRRDLEARIGPAAPLVLSELDTSDVDFQLAIELLQTVLQGPSASLSGSAVLRDAILDLIAVAASKQLERRVKVSRTRNHALNAIRQAVRRNISDPNFSVADAATKAGVSLRYANTLLHGQGTSLGRFILSTRLERCAASLADPGQAHRSIQDIAYSWGFSDQGHFGKRFKEAYGKSPKDYRRWNTSSDSCTQKRTT